MPLQHERASRFSKHRAWRSGARVLPLALVLGWFSQAKAQACVEELRALQGLRQQMRTELIAGNTKAAVALASKPKLELPRGYDYEDNPACQEWAAEVARVHRASCSFERARAQLKSIKTEQPLEIDALQTELEKLSHTARAPFACKDRAGLYLVCQPISETAPDAWCARRVEHEDVLSFPHDAWCKLVDEDGVELSNVNEGSEPTCREDLQAQERIERRHVRAQRRASVAAAGTGIALLAAAAIPLTFVPQGVAKLLSRLGALDDDNYDRLSHRSSRARRRVLPLLGVTALSVSSLSSRFWWAGMLSAGCGVSADVLLAQHWHHHDKTRLGIGITMAVLGAVTGLALNLETLGDSDTSPRYTLMPSLSFGVAQAELGLAGRF